MRVVSSCISRLLHTQIKRYTQTNSSWHFQHGLDYCPQTQEHRHTIKQPTMARIKYVHKSPTSGGTSSGKKTPPRLRTGCVVGEDQYSKVLTDYPAPETFSERAKPVRKEESCRCSHQYSVPIASPQNKHPKFSTIEHERKLKRWVGSIQTRHDAA